ncbi:MAG: amidohydrolase family protein [Clostridiales bacterium]|nr:amidohydrolase family protein [Clostridiales bacterium]
MIVFKNGHVFLGNRDTEFETKHICVEGDKILSVEDTFNIGSEDSVYDLSGCYVTPGLIEPHCHIGLLEHGVGWAGSDENEDHEPIQDNCHAVDGINMHDRSFEDFRKSGITTVGVFPGSNSVIGGYGAAIKCKGNVIDDAVIKSDVGLKVSLGGTVKEHFSMKKKAPLTRMGIMALLNQFILDSKVDQTHEYIINGELPLVIHCERLDDIHSAVRFGEKHNLKIRLVGLSDYEDAKDLLLEKNIKYALGPIMGYATQKETRNRDRYRHIEASAMINGSLTTSHPIINGRYATLQGSIMNQNGLETASVLNALSINAAEFLGVENRVGSIEVGKDADLVVWDGHPLELKTKVLLTIIDGEFVYKGGDLQC